MYHSEYVSKAALLCLYEEDVSKDIEGIPLQSHYALFDFRVGMRGILEEDVLVTGDLHSDMGSWGSQQSWLEFCIGNCGSTHVQF